MVQSLAALIAVRVLFGISEGPAPTAVSKTLSIYVPRDRLGRSNGIVLAGTLVGATAAPTITTAIVLHAGWRAAFLVLLVPGLLLTLAVRRFLGAGAPIPDCLRWRGRRSVGAPSFDPANCAGAS